MKKIMTVISLEVPKIFHQKIKDFTEQIVKDNEVSRSVARHPERAHVSLYVGIFPLENKEKVLSVVEDVSASTPTVSLVPICLNEKDGFLSVVFRPERMVKHLNEQLMVQLNPLRDGLIKEKYTNKETLSKLNPEEKENLEKWGYPYGMDCFSSHLTLCRFENKELAREVVQDVPIDNFPQIKIDELEVVILQKENNERKREKQSFSFNVEE